MEGAGPGLLSSSSSLELLPDESEFELSELLLSLEVYLES